MFGLAEQLGLRWEARIFESGVSAAATVFTIAVNAEFGSKVGMDAGAGARLGMTHASMKINKIEIENIFW